MSIAGFSSLSRSFAGGHAEHAARHERRTGQRWRAEAAVRRRKDFGEGAVHPFGDAAVFAHAARREVAVAVAGLVGDDLDAAQGLFAQRREFTCFGRLAELCARIFVDALRGVPTRAVAAVVADVEGFVAFGRGRRRCAGVVLVAVVERAVRLRSSRVCSLVLCAAAPPESSRTDRSSRIVCRFIKVRF